MPLRVECPISKNKLYEMYVEDGIGAPNIARQLSPLLGGSVPANKVIYRWLKEFSIPTRKRGYSRLESPVSCDELHTLYIKKRMSTLEIACELAAIYNDGKISPRSVRSWLRQCNTPIRSVGEAQLIECPVSKDRLFEMYWKEAMGTPEIAKLLAPFVGRESLSHNTVVRWLRDYTISLRDRSEQIRVRWRKSPEKYREISRRNQQKAAVAPSRIASAQKTIRKINSKGRRASRKTRLLRRITKKCDFSECLNMVTLPPSRMKRSPKHFCSLSCSSKDKSATRKLARMEADKIRREELLRARIEEVLGKDIIISRDT